MCTVHVFVAKDFSSSQCQEQLATIEAEGYLSSYVTQHSRCGSTNTPWLLTASSGQIINIELIDFAAGRPDADKSTHSNLEYTNVCNVYATIKNARKGVATTVCGVRGVKFRKVFVSTSESVEISIVPPKDNRNSGQFLLKYTGKSFKFILPINRNPSNV